ncbi:MAG TPA: helix-turn-helix domain-containing protein [Gemmataceae bacterium]|jgi:HTH-type transcriptional regulator/antitoxin HigA|nr:helix-turn-helix domain-containing protein [Gemmataceae bacterium]
MPTKTKNAFTQTTSPDGKPIPKAYLRLVKRFLLQPLESEQELTEATALADELLQRAELLADEEKYLDVLCGLIEAYEDEHYPIADVSAARMLRFLIEQRGVTQQTVSKETGIANSTITALLQEHREMTRKHIETFARYFGVEPAVFLPGNGPVTGGRKAGRRQRRLTSGQ